MKNLFKRLRNALYLVLCAFKPKHQVKLIVKYKTQKWGGSKYFYPETSKIFTFDKLENVTNKNIESAIDGWVEILDIKQILV
jgi:hypothetical protein